MEAEMVERVRWQLSLREPNKLWCVHDASKPCADCMSRITGDVSYITGDVSYITGNVSNIRGNVSSITGNVSEILKALGGEKA